MEKSEILSCGINRYLSGLQKTLDMRGLIFGIFLLFAGNVFAQNPVNQLDANGLKQGFLTKKDADGKLLCQATFKDNKPVGEMKRFHPNGKIKAVMNFTEGSDLSDAKLFDEHGSQIAQGKYIGQKKTGEWSYLLNNKVVSTETYINGQKNGVSKRYYNTGELLEEANWRNDKLTGLYRTYFKDWQCYMEINYVEGRRNGKFKTVYANGSQELDAFYTDDIRNRNWKYYDETGKLLYTLKFDLGKLLNPEVHDSIDLSKSGTYKTKLDNVPDPEKFMQNPEEYMRLMQTN